MIKTAPWEFSYYVNLAPYKSYLLLFIIIKWTMQNYTIPVKKWFGVDLIQSILNNIRA